MRTTETYKKWLETAYLIFARDGLDKLNVQSLAKDCELPRTNFYYYFIDKDELIDKIIELHFNSTVTIFNEDFKQRCNNFIPDFYELLFDYKEGLQFAKQLFKNRDIKKFNAAHKQGLAISADLIVPKFKDYFNLNLSHDNAKKLWYTLADTWYSRIDFNQFSVEYLTSLALEIMDTLLPLLNKNKIEQDFFD